MKIDSDVNAVYLAFDNDEIAKINKVGFLRFEAANRKSFCNILMNKLVGIASQGHKDYKDMLTFGDEVYEADSKDQGRVEVMPIRTKEQEEADERLAEDTSGSKRSNKE